MALLEYGGGTFTRRLGRANARRGRAALVAVIAVAAVAVVTVAAVTVTVTVLTVPLVAIAVVAVAVVAVSVVAALTVMLASLVPPMPRTPLLVPRTPLFMPCATLFVPRFAFLTRLCVRRGVSSLGGVDRCGVGASTRRRVVRTFGEGRADTRCAAQCAAATLA